MSENMNPGGKPEHDFNIIVNGRPKKVPGPTVSYQQIVALAFDPIPPVDQTVFTIAYRHGNKKGTLAEGQTVPVQNGMIFDVTATNRS